LVFKVAARTVLELGAELISSDAVAIYELVKNAIDAQSKDGVTIELCITFPYSAVVDALFQLEMLNSSNESRGEIARQLEEIKAVIIRNILPDAPAEPSKSFLSAVKQALTPADLIKNLREVYNTTNWIEFRDTGKGMSQDDLLRAYLVIGTPSRKRDLDNAIKSSSTEVPYLGEKGVGRLSAMRLGSRLHVRTATAEDTHFNELFINWDAFNDLDKLVEDIRIEPTVNGKKAPSDYSGTTIRITGLGGNWTPKRIRDVATTELSRLTDPFSTSKRRYRIVIEFNGERIDIPRLDHVILDLAHAKAIGRYEIVDGKARLEATMWCGDLGKKNPPEERRIFLEEIDLRSITSDRNTEIPRAALVSVGPFKFDLYWYNRRLLTGVDSIGNRKRVLELQKQWSGIMLFRDRYRVFPYGDDRDDWLGLDRRALASQGYKMNKAQFIGRVSISRSANPYLMDQTNREGLKDCDEKTVLIELLYFIIQNRLHDFLDEVQDRHTAAKQMDFERVEKRVDDLDTLTKNAIRALGRKYPQARPDLSELQGTFDQMREYFTTARERAEQVEDERDRMIQLAGVGLMLEIVAHELTRSTEAVMNVLTEASQESLPEGIAALFSTLQTEMKTMHKRLRVLDPLSVSARQRRETFDLAEMVKDLFAGHSAQFRRHHVKPMLHVGTKSGKVSVYGVRGMFVQILENLIQNSIYWMDLRRQDERDYHPEIDIRLGAPPTVMEYTDNGPGIQPSLREEVFKAFFSTKGKSRRQGLGLFIAGDCAQHHGGQLYLSNEHKIHRNRLNTFVLELPVGDK
jgi:signal transduction histidine kinase